MRTSIYWLLPVVLGACPGDPTDSTTADPPGTSTAADTSTTSDATGPLTTGSTAADSTAADSTTAELTATDSSTTDSTTTGSTTTGSTTTGSTTDASTTDSSAVSTTADTSTGAPGECAPGDTQPCYSGPPDTADVGLCAAGQRTCSARGEWGACEGEVLPAAETCASPGDEDCDGQDPCAAVYPWSRSFGGVEWQYARRVRFDGEGNLVVLVNISGKSTIDFGGGPLPGAGGRDLALVKYAPDGAHLWSRRFTIAFPKIALSDAIAVDLDGRIALLGDFDGTMDFGGGPLVAQSNKDGFVAVFDPDGNHLWSRALRGGLGITPSAVAYDDSGALLLTGSYSNWFDLGAGPIVPATPAKIFLAKLDGAGAQQWVRTFTGAGPQSSHALAVDSAGAVHVAGKFEATFDSGSGPLVSAGSTDAYLAKFDAQGAPLWAERWGGAQSDWIYALSIDGEDHVAVGGESLGNIDFGGGPLSGGVHCFVAELDGDGAHQWSRLVGTGSPFPFLTALAHDGDDALWMTGQIYSASDFGGGPVAAAGSGDIFLVELDTEGQHVSTRTFGDDKAQDAMGLAASPPGAVAVAGRISGVVDFGDGPHDAVGLYPKAFLAVFGP